MTDPAGRVSGLNHVTLAVGDLRRSVGFYRDLLGCSLRAEWPEGAYFEAGDLWLCLSLDPLIEKGARPDCTHLAFSVSEDGYGPLRSRILREAPEWRENRSEGASTYFLDPDGHKLELHVGSLASRLAHYVLDPDSNVRIVDAPPAEDRDRRNGDAGPTS